MSFLDETSFHQDNVNVNSVNELLDPLFDTLRRCVTRVELFVGPVLSAKLTDDFIDEELVDVQQTFELNMENIRSLLKTNTSDSFQARQWATFLDNLSKRFNGAVVALHERQPSTQDEQRSFLNSQCANSSTAHASPSSANINSPITFHSHPEFERERVRELQRMRMRMEDSRQLMNELNLISVGQQGDFDLIENDLGNEVETGSLICDELETTKKKIVTSRLYSLGIVTLVIFVITLITVAFAGPVVGSVIQISSLMTSFLSSAQSVANLRSTDTQV